MHERGYFARFDVRRADSRGVVVRMVVDANAYTIMPIQNVELTALAGKLADMLKRYDLESISMTVIAGVDDERPYTHITTADKNGKHNALTTLWEDD